MIVGTDSTLFYMNNKINIYDKSISIEDNKGNIYDIENYDIKAMQSIDENFPNADKKGETPTILKFGALNSKIKDFKLTIYDPETEDIAEFYFVLESKIKKKPSKYSEKTADIIYENYDFKVEIDNMEFSNTKSKFNLKYTFKNYPMKLKIGQRLNKDYIYLKENDGVLVTEQKYAENEYYFENYNTIIKTIDFAPIFSLNSSVNLIINNLYLELPINKEIDAKTLLSLKEPKTHDINYRNYSVKLENFFRSKGNYILVLHGEDYNESNKNTFKEELKDRRDMDLNAELVGISPTGNEIIFTSTSKSTDYGTDILFSIPGKDEAYIKQITDLKLRVNSVYVKVDEIKYDINISKLLDKKEKEFTDIKEFIEKSFLTRLEYKANILEKKDIQGFSSKVLASSELKRLYMPDDSMANETEYIFSTDIISKVRREGYVLAIVQDRFRPKEFIKGKMISNVHEIVIDTTNGFEIISDKIVGKIVK